MPTRSGVFILRYPHNLHNHYPLLHAADLADHGWGFACPQGSGAANGGAAAARCNAAVLLAGNASSTPTAGQQSIAWAAGEAVAMAFTPFVPQGFSPQQLQQAYMNGKPPSQCQTIAIVDAYANPNAQVMGRMPIGPQFIPRPIAAYFRL